MAHSSTKAYIPRRAGVTLFVSKLGDNSDGSSWVKAFNTIQKALGAIPDDKGGHRIVIRPDTYMEGNLHPAHAGAEGSHNTFEVDYDGTLGSGASGYAVIDASDPRKGMQSVDWWGFPRCTPEFSGVLWDRWILRHVYITGGDGGLFWDLPYRTDYFSIVVEDSVGIGRAFGGGAGHVLARDDEPIVFRRCCLWSLDWWGDTAGAYVRAENEARRGRPDFFFEDCTLVGPQCALKSGNPGFSSYSHVKLDRCRLVTLNFSQPHGTPTDGIIQSVIDGKYLHVDMEDTTMMGYKVFGVRHNKETVGDIGYTTKGCVQAYVQYQQDVPEGIQPMGHWPVDMFEYVKPPSPAPSEETYYPRPMLDEAELIKRGMCELTPVMWDGRLCHMECVRPGHGGKPENYYLVLLDAETGEELARFAHGYSLGCVFVKDGVFYAFASRWGNNTWNDVTLFRSSDLKNWQQKIVIEQEEGEHLFNSSVCEGPDGFVMAYESNDPTHPAFTSKFATSTDLLNWTKIPDAVFGTDRYAACPCLRYANGYYYQMYVETRRPRWFFETYIARSKDLKHWEQSTMNPVLTPQLPDEGNNASDPEIIEVDGTTYLYYAVGDQLTWMNVKRRAYDGTMDEFFAEWFRSAPALESGTLVYEEEETRRRAQWFTEAKFGMFIHWGLYSLHGKNDKGDYVSWSMEQEGVPVEEYEKYADRFDPQKFDPKKWMEIAKATGMKYVVFTSKHHEGFSMFESELSDYTSEKRAAGRDFCREIAEAAREAGLKIGFYYSWLDWHHPDYETDMPKYVTEFAHKQVIELCTNYGPIDAIWFDGEWDHPKKTWRSEELVTAIRKLQPTAVINDRLGKGERGASPLPDFYTREQLEEIDADTDFQERSRAWEACLTIGRSWGYRHDDAPFKSGRELIRSLVDVVSRGGNMLLNVGPTPDGEIPERLIERLNVIGEWMKKNGDSIYGAKGLRIGGLACTTKRSTLYVHVKERTCASITLAGLQNAIKGSYLLATRERVAFDDATKRVYLPNELPDDAVTVIAVELDGRPALG